MDEVKLLERFKRLRSAEDFPDAISDACVRNCLVDREQKIFEITLAMPTPLPKSTIIAAEEAITKAYGVTKTIIKTQYPPQSWYDGYFEEVVAEAKRYGTLERGFFDKFEYTVNGREISVAIPFVSYGVELVEARDSCGVFESIIRSEFGLDFHVTVGSSDDAQSAEDEFIRKNDEQLRSLSKKSAQDVRVPEEKEKTQAEEPEKKRVFTLLAENAGSADMGNGRFRSGMMVFDISEPKEFWGQKGSIEPVAISEVTSANKRAAIVGRLDSFETTVTRNGSVCVTLGITDNASSITVKRTFKPEECESFCNEIKSRGRTIMRGIQEVVTVYDLNLIVYGTTKTDDVKFGGELYLYPTGMCEVSRVERTDDAPEKRVELHMHTNFSTMDALNFPEFVIDTALKWGWDAISVNDHGNVQSYPIFMEYVAKKPIKMLYGMEAYYVDDTARAIYGSADAELLSGEFVVFDIETTGLTALSCAITEIGAVRVRGGSVVERMDTFVNPGTHIPENITSMTGITDEMVAGAPSQEEAVRAFLDFAGDSILVAHNANFDIGFIRAVCDRNRIPFVSTYLDTLALSRYLNPELKRHRLDNLAEYFKLGNFNHHRACDDAEILSAIFMCMADKLREEGVSSVSEMAAAMSDKADPLKLRPHHVNILVKNLAGMKNLYKLISESYLRYYYRNPRIPKSLLDAHRDGILLGSACSAGELYDAILENKPENELMRIASYYDFLEIMPTCNDGFLIANGSVADEEGLREINRRIVKLGEKTGKPVCATTDAHFLNKEDEIYRQILQKGMKYADADRTTGLYMRTTQEMLDEFSYLGKEKAYETVVTNTRRIAQEIENLRPIPDGTFTPKMEGAEEELQTMCWSRAHELYGEELPEEVESRLKRELDSIISNGFAVLYIIAQRLVHFSEQEGYLVGSRGSVGSSFVATMAGISEVNPLTAHYRCPKCRKTIFDDRFDSGFDMPSKKCPDCGTPMEQDGQNIPFETFLGFKGDKSPDIDLNFSGEVQGRVHKYTEELFGRENVFRAGTLGTLASKTAYGYVMKYLDEKGVSVNRAEINRLVNGCVGVKRTTGQHPGGIVVIPKEYEVYDFTAVQHPADDPGSDIVTTHFPFAFLHDTILKLDELGHDVPTKYKWLERYSGVPVLSVPMNDPEVYELFRSTRPLKMVEDADFKVGTYALPEFGTRNAMQMLLDAKPKNFADLMQISGLSHGTDVWHGNAKELIEKNTCTISDCVGTRDSIMLALIQKYGLEKGLAFKIMEKVRKNKHGLPLPEEMLDAMHEHNVPEWYIESLKKIKYLFPKAHAAAYVMSAIRLGWYKVHRPLEFYAAYFSVAPGGFDAEIISGGRNEVKRKMRELDERIRAKNATAKDADTLSALQIVDESMARGIKYLPIDIYKSDSGRFLPENGKIRMPFNTLAGLGDSAAEKIVTAREEGEFFSKQELAERAKLTKAVMETLESHGVLSGLSQTNQISLF